MKNNKFNDARKNDTFSEFEISDNTVDENQRLHDLKKHFYMTLAKVLQYNPDSLQELLDYSLNQAILLTKSKLGYIFLYNEDKKEFTLNSWSSGVMKECSIQGKNTAYQMEDTGVWGEVIRQRKFIIVNDFEAPNPLKKGYPEGHAKLLKFLSVPIFDRNRVAAVVGVANKETDYSENDAWQLSLLMNNTWAAVERKKSEELLKEEKELFKATLQSIGDAILATDQFCKILLVNGVARRLIGWSQEEAYGKALSEVFCLMDIHRNIKCEESIKKVLETGEISELEDYILISRDGVERNVSVSIAPIKNTDSGIKGIVIAFRDVTMEKQRQKEIEYLSYHDQLTGLYNRRFFEEELRRLDTERNLPISIIMADVNGLKLTNDAFGHKAGDRLLQKAAEVISTSCRSDDIAARLGGDEFVILLPGTSGEEAEKIVRRIMSASSNVSVDMINLSISFGWEAKVSNDEDINDILKKAEDYMYRRKLFEGPSLRGKIVNTVVKTLYETHKREEEHSKRVSMLCKEIGLALGFNDRGLHEIETVGLLHDIGKVAIDESILRKRGPLTNVELIEIKRHPEIGYRILNSVNSMSDLAGYVLAHHERWDGKGYPKGLAEEEIPLASRIIALADAYDVMTNKMSYQETMTHDEAIEIIRSKAGTQFDPKLAEIFIEKVLRKT